MREEPIFELERVSFSYDGKVTALRDVSLAVAAREKIALLGANGSGKSTLLMILAGLYFPALGQVRAFGHPLTEEAFKDEPFAFSFRRKVGLLFQDPDVQLFSPTVWDEVAFAPLQLGLDQEEVVSRVEEALRLLRIESLRDRAPHRLSEGEKKKVAIASILSLHPEVWLLDEPTAGLDPRTESWFLDFICQLNEMGHTVITATHDLDAVDLIADRIYVLSEENRLIAQGTPQEILSDQELLLRCNLTHEHRHRHERLEHAHPHRHPERHIHPHE